MKQVRGLLFPLYKTMIKRSLVTLACRGQKYTQMVAYVYPFVIERYIYNYSTSSVDTSTNTSPITSTSSVNTSTSSNSNNHFKNEYLSYQEILQRRRAIRNFDPYRNIDSFLLKRILIESQTAPSSFNLQPYKVCKFIHVYIYVYMHYISTYVYCNI